MAKFIVATVISALACAVLAADVSAADFTCGTTMTSPGTAPFIATTGTVKALIFFVKFKDDNYSTGGCEDDPNAGWPDTLTTAPAWADSIIDNTTGGPYTKGSLSGYFDEMSDGAWDLIGDVHFYSTPENLSYYEVSSRRRGWLNKEIISSFDATIDYSDYDSDSDGVVDLIIFVYRKWSPLFAGGSFGGIANLGFSGSVTHDTVDIEGGNMESGISQHGQYALGGVRGLAVHEISHFFYDTNHFDFIGGWGIHDGRDGANTMSAYERSLLSWVTPTVISGDSTDLLIEDAITTSDYYRININANEYFLLENRQGLSTYEQAPFCGGTISGKGLMISHIRPTATAKIDRIRWEPADNTFSRNGDFGDSTDTYKPGNKIQFTPWTKPNSNDNSGTSTGIAVTNIRLSGNNITADIDLDFSSGDITEDSWWSGAVDLTGDITVKSGATLTVAAGATVKFATGAGLIVEGTLNVNGTSSNLVTFTRAGASGTWDYIKYQSSGNGTISYATIEYAQKGIWCYSDNVTIENCTIEDFTQQAVYAVYSDITVRDCVIQNPNGASHGIYLYGSGSPTISGNTISGLSGGSIGIYRIYGDGVFSGNTIKNSTTGIQINSSSSPEIYNNYIENTSYGVRLASGSSPDIHDNDIYSGSIGLYLEQSQPSDVKWNNFGWSGSIKENADEGILINYLLSGNSFLSGKKNNFYDGDVTKDISNTTGTTLDATGNYWESVSNTGL